MGDDVRHRREAAACIVGVGRAVQREMEDPSATATSRLPSDGLSTSRPRETSRLRHVNYCNRVSSSALTATRIAECLSVMIQYEITDRDS